MMFKNLLVYNEEVSCVAFHEIYWPTAWCFTKHRYISNTDNLFKLLFPISSKSKTNTTPHICVTHH